MTGILQAGRSILPALLSVLLAPSLRAAPSQASVVPQPAQERDGTRQLSADGARRSQAMLLYTRASRLLAEKGSAAALPVFREAMALDPGNSRLAGKVASLAAAAGQPGEARRLLEVAVAKSPTDPAPLAALARFLLAHQDDNVQSHGEALTTIRTAVAKFPGSPEICAMAVRLYVSGQRRDEAQAAVRATLAKGSSDAEFWLAMAPIARDAFPLDDPDTRAAHLAIVGGCVEKAMSLAPKDPRVMEEAAGFYALIRDHTKAAACYRQLITLQPGNLPARRQLGQTLRLLGDNAGAITVFSELLRIDDNDSAAHRAMSALMDGAGKPEEALRHHVAMLRINGGTADDYLKLSARLEQAGMHDEHRLTLERGCFTYPLSPRLAIAYATALHRSGNIAEATREFERAAGLAAKHDPDALDDAYFRDRALCARDAGERETAAVHFRKAIDKTPKAKPERAVPSYAGLASLWLEECVKVEEARELLHLAASLSKDDPAVAEGLGLYAMQKADWAAALTEFEKAAKAAPTARLTLKIADALVRAGRKEDAIARLEAAAAAPKADPALRAKLDSLRSTPATP